MQSCAEPSSRRLKVLVSAYACEPGRGSEPGEGWHWTNELARFHDLWVVTRANNRRQIQQSLQKDSQPGVRWIYFDLPRWLSFWKKQQRGIRIYYVLWQFGAYLKVRRLMQKTKLDLAHHLTFGTYWLPSYVAFLGIPYIWGPLGGGESVPPRFGRGFSFYGRVFEVIRDLARSISDLNPFIRFTARNANRILTKSVETTARLRKLGADRIQVCQPGISVTDLPEVVDDTEAHKPVLRIISVGRLLHWKGFHYSLKAFAEAVKEVQDMEYWIIGEGPERRRLERLVKRLNLGGRTHFWGGVSRDQVLQKMANADTLVHPSLHDSAGWVCLEAMALSKPVVCLDLGGPSLQVTTSTGFKISASNPTQIVKELANTMTKLARCPELRSQLGRAGRNRVLEHFRWRSKALALSNIYLDSTGFRNRK
jgi:glycosyltransferase involved in cell wall biosynthesis